MQALLDRTIHLVTLALVGGASLFVIYTGASSPFGAPVQRTTFVFLVFPLVFVFTPSGLPLGVRAEKVVNATLVALSLGVFGYTLHHIDRLANAIFLEDTDVFAATLGFLIILEAVRRTLGLVVAAFVTLCLAYLAFGAEIGWRGLRHAGLSWQEIASLVFFGTDGVFGSAVGACATIIVMMIMFGTFLIATGGAELLMNVSRSLVKNLVGGPAKLSVISSALLGIVTGATAANVATSGSLTIPMMKRAGYPPAYAAGVEAVASAGGQLMPPVMGAAAFIMIDYLNISYAQLMMHALVPAMAFYLSLLLLVHLRSIKLPLAEVRELDEHLSLSVELRRRGHLLIPIIVLVAMMINHFGIMFAAFWSTVLLVLASLMHPATRRPLRVYLLALHQTMQAMAPLLAVCSAAGVIVGAMVTTGLNLRLTSLINTLAQGSLFATLLMTMVACIVIGMGMPTVAAYVLLATLLPGALTQLGVELIAAHFFILYFAVLSSITPPVAIASFVAAGIAQSSVTETCLHALRLALILFVIPYAIVYAPELLLVGTPGQIVIATASLLLGILACAHGLERRALGPIGIVPAMLLVGSGILLIWPSTFFSVVGVAVVVVTLAACRIGRKRTPV